MPKPKKAPKKERWSTSSNGRWRTLRDAGANTGLMQFIPSGTYYARAKVRGKSVRASLGTDVFAAAKLRLPEKLKELKTPEAEFGTVGDGRLKYEHETRNGYTSRKKKLIKLAPLSVTYRLRCVECLVRSLAECLVNGDKEPAKWELWDDLSETQQEGARAKVDAMKVNEITRELCDKWAAHYSGYSPTVFNNTLNTFRRILELAGLGRDNPAYEIGRRDILEKPLKLPRPDQFDQILSVVETSGAAQAKDCADLIRFLAFTGARISEAKQTVWADVDWEDQSLQIHSVKVRGAHNGEVTRTLPFNPALKALLERLHTEQKPKPTDRVCVLSECQNSLTRACKLVGCKRLTHHDLRKFFVTKCLQSGVDVLTLAAWAGHRDNGKLLLKVYAKLQTEHSQSMAAKVTFGKATVPASPALSSN